LLIILASWISIRCLAFPPLLVFFIFFFKSPPSSWLILICSWGVFSCSSYGFGWGSSCCFTNCLIRHIEVRWPQVWHLKHFTCLSLSYSFIFLSFSMFGQLFARCPVHDTGSTWSETTSIVVACLSSLPFFFHPLPSFFWIQGHSCHRSFFESSTSAQRWLEL
jgi:hypothetical protein